MTATPPEQPSGAQPPYPGPPPPPPATGQPYPVTPGGQRPPAPEQPAPVALAVKLMLTGAVLSVLSLVYSLATLDGLKDEIRDTLVESEPDVSQSTIDAVYGLAIGSAVVFGLIGAVLWAWMAWKNGQGRAWARVVATVFAGLNILGLLITLAGSAGVEPLAVVLSVLSVVLAIVILALLWRKESSQFYAATTVARRGF